MRPGNPLLFLRVSQLDQVHSAQDYTSAFGHAAIYGIVHEADEGTHAHILQLLMVEQVPMIAFFAFEWLASSPRQAMRVLAPQAAPALAAFAADFLLTWHSH